MNATLVVAASSMVLALFAVVFFLLQNAADGGIVNAYGEMTFPQEEEGTTMSVKYTMDGTTKSVSFSAGGHIAVMTEYFDAYGSRNIQSYEWNADGPLNCRFNLERDFERFDAMRVSMDSVTVGEGSTISVTDGAFETTTLDVSYTMIEGVAPTDWLPAPIDEDTCNELALTFTLGDEPENTDDTDDRKLRELGVTDASNLAESVYGASATCHPTTDYITGKNKGSVCYQVSGCLLAFRGSDDEADWSDNILGSVAYVRGGSGKEIHSGFYNQYKSWYDQAWNNVPSSFKNCGDNKVWIGHSLGGAIAAIASAELGGSINTYAAPKPFKPNFDNGFQKGYRTYHESDPVPQQPFWMYHGCGGDGCTVKKVYTTCTEYTESWGIPYPCNCGWGGCSWCQVKIFDGSCKTQGTESMVVTSGLTIPSGNAIVSSVLDNIWAMIFGWTGSCASAGGHFHSMSACYLPYGQ